MSNSSSSSKHCLDVIKAQIKVLTKLKIPFIFSAFQEGKIVSFGSSLSLDLLNSKEKEFEKTFIDDKDYMEDLYQSEVGESENRKEFYERLKAPLSLSKAQDVRKYARYLITKDHNDRNPDSEKKFIRYGEAQWEASFWPNEMLEWGNIAKNISNIKRSDIPSGYSIYEILKQLIKNALEAKDIDPENFYDETFDKSRKRKRGIIENDEVETEELNDDSSSLQEEILPHSPSSPLLSSNQPEDPSCISNLQEELLCSSNHNQEPSCSSNLQPQQSGSSSDCSITRRRILRSDSLLKLLEIPSLSVQNKQRAEKVRIEAMEHERNIEEAAHRKEMEYLENLSKQMKEKRIKQQNEIKRLQIQSEKLRQNLTQKDIKHIFKANLKYFKGIEAGFETSWRNKMYRATTKRTENETFLRSKMIASPFSDLQQDQIYEEVKKIWLKDAKMQRENNQYVEFVLLPEVFIRIYQKYFLLSSTKVAEEMIMNYTGSIDPADLSPDSTLMN